MELFLKSDKGGGIRNGKKSVEKSTPIDTTKVGQEFKKIYSLKYYKIISNSQQLIKFTCF